MRIEDGVKHSIPFAEVASLLSDGCLRYQLTGYGDVWKRYVEKRALRVAEAPIPYGNRLAVICCTRESGPCGRDQCVQGSI